MQFELLPGRQKGGTRAEELKDDKKSNVLA